jgi:hypothetical protein
MTSVMIDVDECKLRIRDNVCGVLRNEALSNERTSGESRQVVSKKNVWKRANEPGCHKRM